jgi:zinc transport system substrate-binding protein
LNRFNVFVVTILAFLLAAIPVLGGCNSEETSQLKIVTTTSLLAQIVERVGGELVDVVNIIPPSQCPGHFDAKPGDIQKLTDAKLFLLHGWQGEMFSDDLIASANNPDLTTVVINAEVDGNDNWLVPAVQRAAVDKVVAALSQVDSENSVAYERLASLYKKVIADEWSIQENRLEKANLENVKVMCSEQLTGFVQWLGLNIIATYGRPESLTIDVVKNLVDTGREAGVNLIIDNLQSGADAAAGLAEELGCKRIVFTNFPGGFDNTETWEKAVEYDITLVLDAVAK